MLIPQGFVARMVVFGEPHCILILTAALKLTSLEEQSILELDMILTVLLFDGA